MKYILLTLLTFLSLLFGGCRNTGAFYFVSDLEEFEVKAYETTMYYKGGLSEIEARVDVYCWQHGCKTLDEIMAEDEGNPNYKDPKPQDFLDKMYSNKRPKDTNLKY